MQFLCFYTLQCKTLERKVTHYGVVGKFESVTHKDTFSDNRGVPYLIQIEFLLLEITLLTCAKAPQIFAHVLVVNICDCSNHRRHLWGGTGEFPPANLGGGGETCLFPPPH